jgi:hypothetical protein
MTTEIDLRDPLCSRYCPPPKLVKAIFNENDVYDTINRIYGESRGWNCKHWIAKDVFGPFEGKKDFYFEFVSDQQANSSAPINRVHWLKGKIDEHEVINQGLFIPFGSYWGTSSGI